MTYYEDEIAKIRFLRDRIAGELMRSGNYPGKAEIDAKLGDFDSKSSLFYHIALEDGDKFDVEQFNLEAEYLYHDLLIIYQLVYDYVYDKFQKTKAYVEMHLSELEALAEKYEEKTRLELNNTSLGNTIYFQSSGFDQSTENYKKVINLGDLKVKKGSRISFFIEGRYFDKTKAKFYLGDQYIEPYSINGSMITAPGNPSYHSYTSSTSEDIKQDSSFILSSPDLTVDSTNRYIIYAGKNKLSAADSFYNTTSSISLTGNGKVSFYVIGAKYIRFDFAKKPITQNFTGYEINDPSYHHRIEFGYTGGISFSLVTDGIIYAKKVNGIVKEGQLYYPNGDDLHDFRIEEYGNADTITLPAKVIVPQTYASEPYITSIAVKELKAEDDV